MCVCHVLVFVLQHLCDNLDLTLMCSTLLARIHTHMCRYPKNHARNEDWTMSNGTSGWLFTVAYPTVCATAAPGPPSPPPPSSFFTVDVTGPSRTWEGLGGLSAGASSRLLLDYVEPQRTQILNLLFKPKTGASWQILYVHVPCPGARV